MVVIIGERSISILGMEFAIGRRPKNSIDENKNAHFPIEAHFIEEASKELACIALYSPVSRYAEVW
jgi:hypothetical protein